MNVNLLVGELQNDYYTYKGCLYPDQSTLSGEDFELALQQSVATHRVEPGLAIVCQA